MKNKAFTFLSVVLFAALILLMASCRDEVVEDPVIYNDKIDGVAVSTLPPLDESMTNSDVVPSYRNSAAFEGTFSTDSSTFGAPGEEFSTDFAPDDTGVTSSDPNLR